jgi:hypothetical protein
MLGMLGIFQAKSYPIDTPLRSLISVRIAQLNGCWFYVDLSSYNMLKAAGSAEKPRKYPAGARKPSTLKKSAPPWNGPDDDRHRPQQRSDADQRVDKAL